MLERKLEALLQKKGYRRMIVNVPDMQVYSCMQEELCRIIIYYPEGETEKLTRAAHENIVRQVKEFFYNNGHMRLEILSLAETGNPAGTRAAFEEYENVWMLDTAAGRVVLYEGQEDFDGLRQDVEDALYAELGYPRLKEDGEGRRHITISPCNTALVLVNVLIFVLCEIFGSTQDTVFLLEHGALSFPEVLSGHEYYRLFTYMFLHGGIEHLLNNMLILWFLGDNLEKQLGHIKYLVLYFTSGILAGLASMGYNSNIDRYVVCVGASGAIFGVVGALALIVLVNRGRVENLTTRQMLLFIALSLYGGFTSQGVDNAAHIGGLLAGIVLGLLLYRRKVPKAEKRLV